MAGVAITFKVLSSWNGRDLQKGQNYILLPNLDNVSHCSRMTENLRRVGEVFCQSWLLTKWRRRQIFFFRYVTKNPSRESKQKVKNAIVKAGKLANSTCGCILIGKMSLIVSKDGCPCWQLPTVFIEVELVTSLIHKQDCLESTFHLSFPNAWLPPNL